MQDAPLGKAPGPVAGLRRAANALGLAINTDDQMEVYFEAPLTQGRFYLFWGNDSTWKTELRRIAKRAVLHGLATRANQPAVNILATNKRDDMRGITPHVDTVGTMRHSRSLERYAKVWTPERVKRRPG